MVAAMGEEKQNPDIRALMPILLRPIVPPEENPAVAPIVIHIDPGRASVEDLGKLFAAINGLNRAAGGMGYEFIIDEERISYYQKPPQSEASAHTSEGDEPKTPGL